MSPASLKNVAVQPIVWSNIARYLDQALDLEEGERETWLEELNATQPQICNALRRLLAEREILNANKFLESSPFDSSDVDILDPALRELLGRKAVHHTRDFLRSGEQHNFSANAVVGAYRLIREIGHGGMSSVWLAERCDGQLKREVALKLPFGGPRHMQLAERSKRERDILATLTHPNIARLYDAGVTVSGQSYLAMEYVEGTALLNFCDAASLSIRARLKIFEQVLNAVQFAHSQLVIHRDLKPSNILVTEHGRVVLLDFGIAKLLTAEESCASPNTPCRTEFSSHALTPDYASPEQITGQALGTGSDVYSLGVVLHELLTGRRPYRLKNHSRAALEEAILSHHPQRLSQLTLSVSTALTRDTTPSRLKRALKGDLDTIVLKALKKNPRNRYLSIEAFAQDIANYLNDAPVNARPDCPWYRTRRFIWRHKLTVSAAAITLIAVFSGAAIALWQAHSASMERDRALVLASRNEAVTDFLGTLITEAAESDKPVTVSDMLARSEKMALANTSGNRENRAAVLAMIAGHYQSLGLADRATQLLEHAVSLVDNSSDVSLRSKLACQHAYLMSSAGHTAIAIRAITREIDALKSGSATAECLLYLSYIAENTNDAAGGLRYAKQALDIFYATPQAVASNEALFLGAVAYSYHLNGRNQEADEYFKQAMRKYTELGRDRGPDAIVVRNNWALASGGAGMPKLALELYDQTLNIVAERNPDSLAPAYIVHNRARSLELLGRYKEAHATFASGLELANQQRNLDIQRFCLLGLAGTAEELRDEATATQYLNRVEKLLTALPANSPPLLARELIKGRLNLANGQFNAARDNFERATGNNKHSITAVTAGLGKAEAELLMGDATAAVRDAQIALDVTIALQGGVQYSNRTGLASLMLGRALQKLGNNAQARSAFETAVNHLSNTVDADHPALLLARQLSNESA